MFTPETFHIYGKIIGALLIVTVIAILAAQIRISMSRRIGLGMDVLFLLPLVQSLEDVYFFQALDSVFPAFTFSRILIGFGVSAMPVLYLCALLGFQRVQREWIDAAGMQGLGHFGVLWRILLPQSWGLLLGGLG